MTSAMPRASSDLSTVVMYHPSRRSSADRVARESRPLNARLVADPDPTGPPSPLRTAKVAWDAVADGATHHLVLQDDVHLSHDFAAHVGRLIERFPDYAISLGVLWVSPYNSYRVREAASGGFPIVHLAPWEWVPSLGLVLRAEAARELAEFLRTFPDVTRDDDEHIAVFCAKRDIPVVAPVPHLLDHSTRPSVAGNDDHGIRLAVAYVDRPIDAGHWDGPELVNAGAYSGSGFAVDLVESRCNLRIQRTGAPEAAEQPFTWPWRPWSAIVGVPEQAIVDARGAAENSAPQGVPAPLVSEVWAAGFLLGARGDENEQVADHALHDEVETEALGTWLTAGLRHDDRTALGHDGFELLIEWLRRAVHAGRRYATSSDWACVERMAAREVEHLLLTAPDELPDIGLDVRPCAEHDDAAHPEQVTQNLPVRYLAEHLGRTYHRGKTGADVTLAALACERLEPRSLAGLARLAASGWSGVVETRAATAARLRDAGDSWGSVLRDVDAAEERFGRAGPGVVTLPASCRTHRDEFAFLSPHADEALSQWNRHYEALRMRAWRERGGGWVSVDARL